MQRYEHSPQGKFPLKHKAAQVLRGVHHIRPSSSSPRSLDAKSREADIENMAGTSRKARGDC